MIIFSIKEIQSFEMDNVLKIDSLAGIALFPYILRFLTLRCYKEKKDSFVAFFV